MKRRRKLIRNDLDLKVPIKLFTSAVIIVGLMEFSFVSKLADYKLEF